MIRILLLLLLISTAPALAQTAAAPAAAPPAASGPSQAQARSALDILKDEKRRAELIAVLETMAAASPAETVTLPLAPDSLGAQLIAGASERLDWLSKDLWRVVNTVTDFPLVLRWFEVLFTDLAIRAQIIDTGWRLAVALGCALGLEWMIGWLLRRPRAALARRAPTLAPEEVAVGIASAEEGHTERLPRRFAVLDGLLAALGRLPFAIGGLALDLLAVAGVLAVAYGAVGSGFAAAPAPRFVTLAVLHAYALFRAVNLVARTLIAAEPPALTLLVVETATAQDILGWLRWISGVAIFGVTMAETALLFGMYRLAHDTVLKLLALAVTLMLCAAVMHHRVGIAALLRPPAGATGVAAVVRDRIAGLWHLVACGYLLSLWVVWALELPDGFTRLLRLSVMTALILTVSWLVHRGLQRALGRVSLAAKALPTAETGLAGRLRTYLQATRGLVRFAINVATLLALLSAWGIPVVAWFAEGRLGARLAGALANLGATFAFALIVWEGVNFAIERHLARLAIDQQAARSARLRTLLPMLRTSLLVAILAFTFLITLSEIGVNIAPLLAGAGVIGLAIGFGSQKLVQDIITGLFLLLENAMQVGDTVTLGGLSGTVENLSIRTIRLRAIDGAVHIIPFSAVTTVTNMTRDFGYAVIDVSIGLNETPERIGDILREIAADMRKDMLWQTAMTGELDVMGVEKFLPNAWVMRARVRTTPGQRWAVGRELNRRIKDRFDELAIDSPMTSFRALGRLAPGAATLETPA